MRISVAWTSPGERGALTAGRRITKARTPAAAARTMTTASACSRRPRLDRTGTGKRHPPRRGERQDEINRGEQPQIQPVGAHLGEPRAHLADAHEAVDGRLTREDAAQMVEQRRHHLARPGYANQEELRQGGRDEHQY